MELKKIEDREYIAQYVAGEFDPLDRENLMAQRHMIHINYINFLIELMAENIPEKEIEGVIKKLSESEEWNDMQWIR
ncbi:hypothetical protein QTO17_40805, partial [Vibrio owensii]